MLEGKQLLAREVARLAHNVGFRDKALLIAVAVCSAESSRYTEANNLDADGNPTNPDGSVDYGLWQINSGHFGKTIGGILVDEAACLDPVANARIAFALQAAAGSWLPWAAFASTAYLDYIEGAAIGIKNYWLERYDIPLGSGE